MDTKTDKSGGGHGPTSTTTDCSDGEEQDEPSSTEQLQEVEDVLASFREKWQKELRLSPKRQNVYVDNKSNINNEESDDCENNARMLFLKGIEMEKAGKLYEAIQFYRRAVQIVPDIESKLDKTSKPKQRDRQIMEEGENENEEDINTSASEDSDEEQIKEGELLLRIQKKLAKVSLLCIPKFEQQTTHISQLPVEIMLYILRWIVSGDLDLRMLEVFSEVCRGFYLCARDPEIWRSACLRVWGLNCGSSPGVYGSWREMFIERPRIQFNGCYISKTSYMRYGENSFQDQFYRPWHLVTYYRYLRFFPDGTVLMLTSADEPSLCVSLMKYKNVRHPISSGYYRLKDDKITLVVQRQDTKVVPQVLFKRNSRRRDTQENAEQTFHMELQIKNHNNKRHVQLMWTHYSVFTKNKKGDDSTCNFDLITNRFPPLWFSRVRSFTAESENPLI